MSAIANLLVAGMLGVVPDLALENANIAIYDARHYSGDVNRLRADLTLEHERHQNLLAKCIVDNESVYASHPDGLQNTTSIYRAYLQYRGRDHFWALGRQRVPLGVGRVWNPIDLFNPVNSEAIETGERIGTESIRYEYAITPLSNLDATLSRDKGAMRLKGYLYYADVGLVGLWDEEGNRDVMGWELAGELSATGIELRSEGGSFHDRDTGERYTELIVGGEYGFANSLTLLAEYKYSDETNIDYLGGRVSYQPAMLWLASVLTVTNMEDNSYFLAPSIEYSLSDEMTLSVGAFLYNGADGSEYGQAADLAYFRWFVHL